MNEQHPYFINQEELAEMYRLYKQGQVLTAMQGGVLPERPDFVGMHEVLDVACGPAEWALQLATQQPDVNVVGVDLSERITTFNTTNATANRLRNATFTVMDVMQGLAFPDSSFDLVNARLVFGFMTPATWPRLIQECLRVLRPGGSLRMTEGDASLSNSPASERFHLLLTQALQQVGRSYLPDARHASVVPMLRSFFQHAGCNSVQERAYVLNYSFGTPAHESWSKNILSAAKLLKTFLVEESGVISQDEYALLVTQLREEMKQETFCAVAFFLTVYGQKPEMVSSR